MWSMREPGSGILAKIERAEIHRSALAAATRAFVATKPCYIRIEEPHLHAGQWVARLMGNRFIPPLQIGAIIGDIAHNLGSALDVLAADLTRANGNEPGRSVYFPLRGGPNVPEDAVKSVAREALVAWADEPRNRSDYQRYTGGMSAEARQAIQELGTWGVGLHSSLYALTLLQLHEVELTRFRGHPMAWSQQGVTCPLETGRF